MPVKDKQPSMEYRQDTLISYSVNRTILSVMAAVELDDSSHNSKKRRERDEFLEGACDAAQLKLHRFKAKSSYNISEVRGELFPSAITEVASTLQEREAGPAILKPRSDFAQKAKNHQCPECSSELIHRVARQGKHKGSQFLACSAFPKCRYIAKQSA